MTVLTMPARRLGDADRVAVERLLERDPVAAAPVIERLAARRLGLGQVDGALFGFGERRHLTSVCWVGGNLLPVNVTPIAVPAFAEVLAIRPAGCSSVVGPADATLALWERLRATWGSAREVRAAQPLLVTDRPPSVPADPGVRLVRRD